MTPGPMGGPTTHPVRGLAEALSPRAPALGPQGPGRGRGRIGAPRHLEAGQTVPVYGSGCKRCDATEKMIKEVAAKLGIDVVVAKVTDQKSIAMARVMSTPGIAVDGKLVHAGGLPDAGRLDGWLRA